MPYDYSEDAATAVEMIAEFGRPMTLTVTTASETPGPAWNPEATETSTVTTVTTLTGVQTSFSVFEKGGDTVEQGDVQMIFDGSVEIPNEGRIDGYSIVEVMPVQPGDTVLLYRVQCRR